MELKLPIVEIFDSIQGEGYHMGEMVTFIRTSGCNLACPWCDTKESWGKIDAYKEMTLTEIMEEVHFENVVITGGEPTIHGEALDALIAILKQNDCYVCIETNGTNPVNHLVDWVTCSPKPGTNYFIHPHLRPDELKYVVDENFDDMEAIPEEIRDRYAGLIWLQPEGGDMMHSWKNAMALVAADDRLRVGVQLHKVMEVK